MTPLTNYGSFFHLFFFYSLTILGSPICKICGISKPKFHWSQTSGFLWSLSCTARPIEFLGVNRLIIILPLLSVKISLPGTKPWKIRIIFKKNCYEQGSKPKDFEQHNLRLHEKHFENCRCVVSRRFKWGDRTESL